ncbi:MAG: HAD family hydrolase [Methanomicrobiales archaeon]|nr:HAD family hydrolase [Methanomicrobiales archaeon]
MAPKSGIKPRACLFDMDNTLYDFVNAKIAGCTSAVTCIGCGEGIELFRYFLRNVHGFEDHNNIRDFMIDRNAWDDAAYAEACCRYEEEKLQALKVFEGVAETLCRLKDEGISMAVVTDADSAHATARLQRTGLSPFFDCVITPDVSGKRKPEPDSFLCALQRLDCHPGEAWVVGDSLRREIAPGKMLGMTTAYAEYGDWLRLPSPDIRPDFVLKRFSELIVCMEL